MFETPLPGTYVKALLGKVDLGSLRDDGGVYAFDFGVRFFLVFKTADPYGHSCRIGNHQSYDSRYEAGIFRTDKKYPFSGRNFRFLSFVRRNPLPVFEISVPFVHEPDNHVGQVVRQGLSEFLFHPHVVRIIVLDGVAVVYEYPEPRHESVNREERRHCPYNFGRERCDPWSPSLRQVPGREQLRTVSLHRPEPVGRRLGKTYFGESPATRRSRVIPRVELEYLGAFHFPVRLVVKRFWKTIRKSVSEKRFKYRTGKGSP